MSVSIIYYRHAGVYCQVRLPDLTNHLASFADDVISIINETDRLVAFVKEYNEVRRMPSVHHALSEITRFVVKGYEYVNLLNHIPYYFHCNVDGESLWTDFKNCQTRFEKGNKSLADSEEVYETLVSYCKYAEGSCDTAARKLEQEAESVSSKKTTAYVTGAVLGTACIGTGIALSVVAGIFTLGIGTVVGLATTAAVASAAGIGSSVAGAVIGGQYSESVENFKKLSNNFRELSKHGTKLFGLAKDMRTSMSKISTNLGYSEAHVLLVEMNSNGKKAYSITCSKRLEVYRMKNALQGAIKSV